MFTFLNPIFLGALGAAVIPLVLHLLKRRQAVRVLFSTLRFLKAAQKKSSRRMKMENFLLWLLRTLLLLTIALAFAMPVLRTSSFGGFLGRSQRVVAIVWDASYSMGYATGQRRVWDDTRDTVLSVLKGLQRGDQACVFMAENEAVPLIAEPVKDLALVEAQVKAQQPHNTSSRLLPAVQAAARVLRNSGKGERELYIVTDGQAAPWLGFGAVADNNRPAAGTNAVAAAAPARWDPQAVDREIACFVLLAGPDQPANAAPAGVELQPRTLAADLPATLTVKYESYGMTGDNTLTLYVDDHQIARQAVNSGQGGAEAVFNVPPLPPGVHAARVESEPDALALDNALYFILRVREKMPVLVVGQDADTFFVRHALNPGGHGYFQTKALAPDAVPAGEAFKYGAIFLCNAVPLPGQLLLDIEQYVRQGGLAVFFPGERAGAADYANLNCLPARPVRVAEVAAKDARALLRLISPQDPIFASLRLPPGTIPFINVRRQVLFDVPAGNARTVIAAQDDRPILLARNFGRGMTLMFAIAADRDWSDFPLTPYFLPFLHQIAQYGAGLGREPLQVTCAHDLPLAEVLPGLGETLALRAPDGGPVGVRRVKGVAVGGGWHAENVMTPGIYTLAGGTGAPAFAANVSRDESDVTPLKSGDVPKLLGLSRLNVARDAIELARQIANFRIGRPVAEALLWLALFLAALELYVANRIARRRGTLSDQMSVDMAGRIRNKS